MSAYLATMKTLAYFPNHIALNGAPVMEAFLQGARRGFNCRPSDMDADVAVIWSCLWNGRMLPNKQIYEHFRQQGRPVIIIEVGALRRNVTWKIAVNHITTEGHYGHTEHLDWDRPKKLGLLLSHRSSDNGRILIAGQHHRSLQLQHLASQEHWINEQIGIIRTQTDREIVVRSHPRSPLHMPSQRPRKIAGTYDDFDFDAGYHAVVNYSSGPAIQSAMQGTPVITSQYSLAHAISNDINRINELENRANQQWLTEISHTEYLVEEIARGTWLDRLQTWV
jgi:hypothetical protein